MRIRKVFQVAAIALTPLFTTGCIGMYGENPREHSLPDRSRERWGADRIAVILLGSAAALAAAACSRHRKAVPGGPAPA